MVGEIVVTDALQSSLDHSAIEDSLADYAVAIKMVRGVHETMAHSDREGVRHWSLPLKGISADFFCSLFGKVGHL